MKVPRPPVFVMKPAVLNNAAYAYWFRENRGEISKIVILASVGDGFQVFGISPVGDADICGLSLLCRGNSFRLGHEGCPPVVDNLDNIYLRNYNILSFGERSEIHEVYCYRLYSYFSPCSLCPYPVK